MYVAIITYNYIYIHTAPFADSPATNVQSTVLPEAAQTMRDGVPADSSEKRACYVVLI